MIDRKVNEQDKQQCNSHRYGCNFPRLKDRRPITPHWHRNRRAALAASRPVKVNSRSDEQRARASQSQPIDNSWRSMRKLRSRASMRNSAMAPQSGRSAKGLLLLCSSKGRVKTRSRKRAVRRPEKPTMQTTTRRPDRRAVQRKGLDLGEFGLRVWSGPQDKPTIMHRKTRTLSSPLPSK